MKSKAHRLTTLHGGSHLSTVLPLNGNFDLPSAPNQRVLLINNNINITPLLFRKGMLGRGKRAPMFLVKTHSGGRLLPVRTFRSVNGMCVAASSNDRNRGNCIAQRALLSGTHFSLVRAYKPHPVVRTITHCTQHAKVRYRISLRGAVKYNVKMYLYYIRGAVGKRLHIYGSNPMFGVGSLL